MRRWLPDLCPATGPAQTIPRDQGSIADGLSGRADGGSRADGGFLCGMGRWVRRLKPVRGMGKATSLETGGWQQASSGGARRRWEAIPRHPRRRSSPQAPDDQLRRRASQQLPLSQSHLFRLRVPPGSRCNMRPTRLSSRPLSAFQWQTPTRRDDIKCSVRDKNGELGRAMWYHGREQRRPADVWRQERTKRSAPIQGWCPGRREDTLAPRRYRSTNRSYLKVVDKYQTQILSEGVLQSYSIGVRRPRHEGLE